MFESIPQLRRGTARSERPDAERPPRHADYYVELSEAAAPKLAAATSSSGQATSCATEVDNFRVALSWAVEADSADRALRTGGVAPRSTAATIGYSARTGPRPPSTCLERTITDSFPPSPRRPWYCDPPRRSRAGRCVRLPPRRSRDRTAGSAAASPPGPDDAGVLRGDAGAGSCARRGVGRARAAHRRSLRDSRSHSIMSSTAQRTTGEGDLARASTEEALQIARALLRSPLRCPTVGSQR